MDSHYFSEAIPCRDGASPSHDPGVPTWTVQVIRHKGDVIVGTLIVNAETFPPRINPKTKKCLWKLPDSLEISPRFGEHEKKRLWELYKDYKKERRKKKRDDDDISVSESQNVSDNVSNGMAALSLNISTDAPAAAPAHSTSASKTANHHALPTPCPPPGFAAPLESRIPSSPTLPPGIPTDAPERPRGTLFGMPPSTPSVEATAWNPAMALGSVVAAVFLQTIGVAGAAVRAEHPAQGSGLDTWMAYYSPHALKYLLLGRAKAEADSHDMIRRQWDSLTQLGSVWECHGWVAQAVSLSHPNDTVPSCVWATFTGKTLQPGMGWLYYTLSLLLQSSAEHASQYAIVNDVLTLQPLTIP